MSDTAVATPVETAAPVTTETTAPVVTPTSEATPEGPLTQRQARSGLHEMSRRAFEAIAKPETPAATEQPRDETGKFVKTETTDAAAAAGASTAVPDTKPEAAAAETRAPDATPEAEAGTRPNKIRVELPAGHALREMGQTFIEVGTEAEAQVLRAAFNGTYTRRKDVERLEAELTKERDARIRTEAKLEAEKQWKKSPEYAANVERYTEIRDTVGPEAAAKFWEGVQQDYAKIETAEIQTRMEAVELQELDAAAAQWRSEALEQANTRIPEQIRTLPEFGRWFNEAVDSFNTELEAGHYPDVESWDTERMFKEFERFFAAKLSRIDAVTTVVSQIKRTKADADAQEAARKAEAERVRLKNEADTEAKRQRDAELKAIADRRSKQPPHAMGSVAHATVAGRTSLDAEQPVDTSKMSTAELRKHLQRESREDARRRLQGI